MPVSTAAAFRDSRRSRTVVSRRWRAPIAGAVAAAVSLGVAELMAGILPGGTSLVAAVGQVVIDLQPPGAKDFVVVAVRDQRQARLRAVHRRRLRSSSAPGSGCSRAPFRIRAPPGSSRSASSASSPRCGDPLANPGITAATAAIAVGAGLWVLGWLLGPSPASATADGTTGADARLVAPLVPDPGRRRRRWRVRRRVPRAHPARAPARRAGRQRTAHPAGLGRWCRRSRSAPTSRRPSRT